MTQNVWTFQVIWRTDKIMSVFLQIIDSITTHIIPITVAATGAFSDVFSKIFIRPAEVHRSIGHHINYLLVGQSVLVCPLSALVSIMKSITFQQKTLEIFSICLYLAIYLVVVLGYLRMSADKFENVSNILTVKFYTFGPIVLIIISIVLGVVQSLG